MLLENWKTFEANFRLFSLLPILCHNTFKPCLIFDIIKMVSLNYEGLIEKIAIASGLSKEEIDRKVEAKCAKLSGLISKEGSAQIVASELGISFDKEKLKISEIVPGMKKVNLVGKIIEEPRINNFKTKNNIEGKVASMVLADETNNIRLVLWDTKHIALFEEGRIKNGDVIEVSNVTIRNDEIHLGSFGDIKITSEVLGNVVKEKKISEKKIVDLKSGTNAKIRAFIVQMFEPKFFEICSECGKKAINNECLIHGKISPEKRALISLVLDDGSENMKAVIFQEGISKLGISKEELNNTELFVKKKQELLGKESFFSANIRNNAMFNTTEMIINDVETIELDNLIEGLR